VGLEIRLWRKILSLTGIKNHKTKLLCNSINKVRNVKFALSSALIKACLFVQLKLHSVPRGLAHLAESRGTSRSLASVRIFLLRAKF